MRFFEYRTLVSFEETNVVGNVYFSNYFVWQGKCREAFLCKYASQVLDDFKAGYGMITKDASCEFHSEAFAFQNILIKMGLESLMRTGMSMTFEYYREEGSELVLLAQGKQTTMWVNPQHKVSIMPDYLYGAIEKYTNSEEAEYA